MCPANKAYLVSEVARAAHPLTFNDDLDKYDVLMRDIGDARLVLIGEASHGTHDFYRERARITRRLIEERGFSAVAAEADWPDAYRLNLFVRGEGADADAQQALSDFRRFPAWMWRNMDVVGFADWLRTHNRSHNRNVGFYGLDLYSLYASAQAVLHYLDKIDPAAAARARYRYSCFDQFGEDTQAYGYAAGYGMTESCEQAVAEQLTELRRRADRACIPRWPFRQNRTVFRGAERPSGTGCGTILSHHVRRPHEFMECARPAHGGDTG